MSTFITEPTIVLLPPRRMKPPQDHRRLTQGTFICHRILTPRTFVVVPFSQCRRYERYRHIVAFLVPLVVVHGLYWPYMIVNDKLHVFTDHSKASDIPNW